MTHDFIEEFDLEPHPEGGFYRRIYTAGTKASDESYPNRACGSAIYYYLDCHDFSAWHRLDADELWHHYAGSTMTIHIIDEEGQLSHHTLGEPFSMTGAQPQVLVPAGHWFATEVDNENSFCFSGCTVSPAYLYETFELATKDSLTKQYPQHRDIIERLTRQ